METKKIVVLGGGYSGIAAAKAFQKKLGTSSYVEITLIEKNSYHTLLTELHEAAAGRVRPSALRISYDDIFKRHSPNFAMIQDEILNIDFDAKELRSAAHCYSYDYLVIATGSRPEFFGIQGVEHYGFKLWSYKEAVVLRDHIQDCFYQASATDSRELRQTLLTFAVAGGGFTGVEMVGELSCYCKALCRKFAVPQEEVSIYLIEAMPSILGNLKSSIIRQAMKYLKKLGVEVLTNCSIQQTSGKKIFLSNDKVIEGTLIWTAGIKGNPYIQKADIDLDHRNRIKSNQFLQSIQHETVFCAGDTISYLYKDKPLPQIVENAMQSGEMAALNICHILEGKALQSYEPKFHGSMISIGPVYAVAMIGKTKVTGILATLLKHFVHGHYHFHIGGPMLAAEYLKEQFIVKYVDPVISKSSEALDKQVTQFL